MEYYYFVTYVVGSKDAPQRMDNGVIALPEKIEGLRDIRKMEEIIKGRVSALTASGGTIIGDAGIQVRVMDYKVIRAE